MSPILRTISVDSVTTKRRPVIDTTIITSITETPGVNCKLTWDYDDLEGLHNFLIYRSVDNSPMQAYATTNGRGGINFFDIPSGKMGKIIPGQFVWDDLELGVPDVDAGGGAQQGGSTTDIRGYKYRVMARHFDGGFSPLSAVVVISVDISRI